MPRFARSLLVLLALGAAPWAAPWAIGGASAQAAARGSGTALELLGPSVLSDIGAKGKATRIGDGSALAIAPAHPAVESIRAAIAAEKPSVVVETAFVLARKRPSDEAARKAELASIYGALRSFSTLKGIEYYSVSRKAIRVLYEESHRIASEADRAPLPDLAPPAPDALPTTETELVLQKDTTFGTNLYRYSLASFDDAVLLEATNLTRFSYALVPMVAPGALHSRLLVVAAEDAIVFYAESAASAPGLVRARLGESFANRAEALFKWFSGQAKSFVPQEQ
jgi:hypothetical protein